MKPPVYSNRNISLKPYQEKDLQRFLEIILDPLSVQYMGGARGDALAEAEMFRKIFQVYEKENSERWFWIWGIYNEEKLCGHLELKQSPNTFPDELEIVYMIHPEERNKGLMKDVFGILKMQQPEWKRTIIATVNPENARSISLLQYWGIEKSEKLTDPDSGKAYLKLHLAADRVSRLNPS